MPSPEHFKKELHEFLEKLRKHMAKHTYFPFWEWIEEFEKLMQNMPELHQGTIENNVLVKGRLYLEEGATIKSGTRIEGNAYIASGATVGPNAYLRKFVYLGKGCKIANSEIKNTIVLEHSNIPHFSYVGDSIIGRDVNLGAGTKIANLRFDGKAISVTLHGDKVDSGRRKLGALIHDGTKIGINASINCGVILPKHSKVLPGQVVMGGNNSSKS